MICRMPLTFHKMVHSETHAGMTFKSRHGRLFLCSESAEIVGKLTPRTAS